MTYREKVFQDYSARLKRLIETCPDVANLEHALEGAFYILESIGRRTEAAQGEPRPALKLVRPEGEGVTPVAVSARDT